MLFRFYDDSAKTKSRQCQISRLRISSDGERYCNNVCTSLRRYVCVLVNVRALACVEFIDYRSITEKNL